MVNRNTLYADVFVDELARSGLEAVCIAPGSRSTALTLAFARHAGIRVYTHLDERSAAFFALGLALSTDKPVAVLCTSGTAAANFYPAIIEAHQSRVPMIVITSDRPHELRHSGANQTIDQVKMYGDFVLWAVDAALPEADPAALTLRNLRSLANRAYAKANGLRKGAVQINMPFRKPLEPTPVATDRSSAPEDAMSRAEAAPFARFAEVAYPLASEATLKDLTQIMAQHPKGLIVCGPRSLPDANPEAMRLLQQISQHSGYPLLTDAASGLRFDQGIGAYDSFLMKDLSQVLAPELVIRIGDVPTSRWLNEYLDKIEPLYRVHIRPDGEWADDSHRVSHFIQADLPDLLRRLLQLVPRRHESEWMSQFSALESRTWAAIAQGMQELPLFDGAAVYAVAEAIPDEASLFIGNSLSIRHVDQFARPQGKHIVTLANRGASGIDGNISTALGAAAGRPDQPLVMILGDITLYHDMNGLLALHRLGIPATIVLLNNDGGGIFRRLPVRDFEPEFTDLFLTPHGLDFSKVASLYGLTYEHIESVEALRSALSTNIAQRGVSLLEIRSDSKLDLQYRQQIVALVQTQLQALVDSIHNYSDKEQTI